MQLSGKDDSGNEAGNAEKDLAPIAFVDNSSISVSTNASMKQQDIVLANKNQNLATFIVKPANKAASANLDKLVFTLDANLKALVAKHVAAGLSADDLFEVIIGDNDKADNLELKNSNATLEVTDLNKDIEGEVKVTVNFLEKLET
jgi:hypothetical protein